MLAQFSLKKPQKRRFARVIVKFSSPKKNLCTSWVILNNVSKLEVSTPCTFLRIYTETRTHSHVTLLIISIIYACRCRRINFVVHRLGISSKEVCTVQVQYVRINCWICRPCCSVLDIVMEHIYVSR